MTLIIDRFKETDKEDWFNLWHQMDGWSLQNNRLDIPQSSWQRIMSEEKRLQAYGLRNEADRKMVGFVFYRFNASTKTANDECCMCDIFIDPAFRKQGGGRQLMAAVEQEAKNAKADRLCWIANPSRAESMDFYKGTGGQTDHVVFIRWLNK